MTPDDRAPQASGARTAPVLLVDGRSGSGKSELARLLAAAIPDAQLVRLDDLYPGWDGLAAGAAHAAAELLPRGRWRAWDWAADAPGEWHTVDPGRPLVVEGCGALGRASAGYATLTVWLDLDDTERKRRALERDGPAYAPHWERWAAQELAWIETERPRELADLVLDGTSVAPLVPVVVRALAAVG